MTSFEFQTICGEYFIDSGLVLEVEEVIEALKNKALTEEKLKEIIENKF